MKITYLAPLAIALLVTGCSVKDSNSPEAAQTVPVEYNQTLVSLPPMQVNTTALDPILSGDTVAVDLQGNLIKLNLATSTDNQTLISITDASGVTTYFQKEAGTVALRKDVQTFLQGVWVAIAQVKGGVHFKLVVDSQNRLTLTIVNAEQGIQIDIQIQGTPSQEQVAAAEQQFLAWVDNGTEIVVPPSSSSAGIPYYSSFPIEIISSSSSQAIQPVSSSQVISPPNSSSQFVISSSSSSVIIILPISSSAVVIPPVSSSAIVIPPVSSSSSITLTSSNSNKSSSSANTCTMEQNSDGYAGYLVEMCAFSWNNIKASDCNNATATRVVQNTTRYYKITFTGTATYNPAAGTLKVERTNNAGIVFADLAPCTRTIANDGGKVWETTTSSQAFLTCMEQL